MPDVSSLLSSWKAERENDAFPLPCLDGVVLSEKRNKGFKVAYNFVTFNESFMVILFSFGFTLVYVLLKNINTYVINHCKINPYYSGEATCIKVNSLKQLATQG